MRVLNGVAAGVVSCFFAVHGLLGSFAPVLAFASPLRWTVWLGVAAVAAHVVLSVATSREQLADVERPASPRKKRHLALKWITGLLLAAVAGLHIACVRAPGMFAGYLPAPRLAITAVAAVLAWHICVGAKSLLTDLGLSKDLMTPMRITACVVAAAIVAATWAI